MARVYGEDERQDRVGGGALAIRYKSTTSGNLPNLHEVGDESEGPEDNVDDQLGGRHSCVDQQSGLK